METFPFLLSMRPAARRTFLPRCLAVLLAGLGLMACNTARMSQRTAFSKKMDSLRGEAVRGHIPRTRVLAVLGLSGPPAERISGGARGGYVTGSETWRLPWGDDIICLEHQPLSRKDIAFTWDAIDALIAGHPAIDALIAGHPSPVTGGTLKKFLAASRPPEPLQWYDTLVLRDRRNRAIRTVECDYWRYRPAHRGGATGSPEKSEKGVRRDVIPQ